MNSTGQFSTQRLPWAAMLMLLVALAALYLASAHWILVFSAALVLGAQFNTARLDNHAPSVRIGRYVLFGIVGIGAYFRFTSDTGGDSLEMILAHAIGHFCAAELALQAWLQRPTSGSRPPASILLATLLFLSASNTFDNRFIPFLTPLFFACLGVALREFACPNREKSRRVAPAAAPATIALFFAVVLGAGSHYGVYLFRNEISQWGMKFLEGKTVQSSGISTSPDLGRRFQFGGGLTRMLRTEGLPAFSYLRAMAFSDYRVGRWGPSPAMRNFERIPPALSSPGLVGRRARIERLVNDGDMVFAPLHVVDFGAGFDSTQLSLEHHRDLGPVRTVMSQEEFSPHYSVVLSDNEAHQGPLCPAPDKNWRARFLQIPPELDPRVRLLAERISAKAKTAEAKVRAVENYLIAHHAYSLRARPGTGDKVSDFLLNGRSAHCEYFASAAVLMLRCLGVPSRYVIGYLAHEQAGKNALIVRGRDAHAWAESFANGRWITVEATPGGGRPEGRAEPLPLALKWQEALNGWLKSARYWLEQLRALPLTLWLGILGILFAWLVFSAWRQRSQELLPEEFQYTARDEQLNQISADFERWLAGRGLPCPRGQTWQEHTVASGLTGALPFIAAYDGARFGRPHKHSNDVDAVFRLLLDLKNQPPELPAKSETPP